MTNKILNRIGIIIFGLLLLQLTAVQIASADADNDWTIELDQSIGTKACIEGGWTKDGDPIEHPGGFYTLCCNGTKASKTIPKEDIRIEPNDADYDIRIWWSDGTYEEHVGERIDAPGSKQYLHNSSGNEEKVVFSANVTKEGASMSDTSRTIFTGILLVFSILAISFRKNQKE